MNCPRCETSSLVEVDRSGITIDRCERCRGIWLDRGELEKLTNQARDYDRGRHERHDDDDDDDRHGGRRGSRWWDIFD